MERLTLWNDGYHGICHDKNCDMFMKNCQLVTARCEAVQNIIDRLAHYEDLEEQGRLVVLPCAVGDSFFRIERFCDEHGELEEAERHWGSDCEYCCKPCNAELRIIEYGFANIRHIRDTENVIGKTVFLSRAEAEAALAHASDVPEGEGV